MNIRILLLPAAAIALALPMRGADPRLIFDSGDTESSYVVKVSDIQRISFAPDGLDLTGANGVMHFSYATLTRVGVDYEGTTTPTVSVAEIAVSGDMRVAPSPATDVITVTGAEGPLDIFSSGGTHVWNTLHYSGAPIDVNALPSGVYIVKSNNKTAKFFKL